jgi:GT2 family glycosyltransferase
MSVKRDEAIRVGGFDTNFLRSQHREESEFCARYLRAGNKFYFEPKASLTHLAASYGGTRHKGDFADFPDYYKNSLYFVLRYCKWYDLPIALLKHLRFFCLRKKPLVTMRRTWLFLQGLCVATARIMKPHRTTSVIIKEYTYE